MRLGSRRLETDASALLPDIDADRAAGVKRPFQANYVLLVEPRGAGAFVDFTSGGEPEMIKGGERRSTPGYLGYTR